MLEKKETLQTGVDKKDIANELIKIGNDGDEVVYYEWTVVVKWYFKPYEKYVPISTNYRCEPWEVSPEELNEYIKKWYCKKQKMYTLQVLEEPVATAWIYDWFYDDKVSQTIGQYCLSWTDLVRDSWYPTEWEKGVVHNSLDVSVTEKLINSSEMNPLLLRLSKKWFAYEYYGYCFSSYSTLEIVE